MRNVGGACTITGQSLIGVEISFIFGTVHTLWLAARLEGFQGPLEAFERARAARL